MSPGDEREQRNLLHQEPMETCLLAPAKLLLLQQLSLFVTVLSVYCFLGT